MKEKFEDVLEVVLLVLKVVSEEFKLRLIRELTVMCLKRIKFRRGVRELEELCRERNKFFEKGDWRVE